MAKTRPLTNTEVKQAKGSDKPYKLADGEGLQLRVKPNGSKSWLLDYYKPFTKKRTSISLGIYPHVGLADARKLKAEARALLAQDIDPKEHKDNVKRELAGENQNTFYVVADHWFQVKKTKVTDKYADDVWRSLELHLLPEIGKLPVSKLTAPLVIAIIKPIAASGALETVKRLCQRINEIMTFAVNTGVLLSNPLAGVSKAFETPTAKNMPSLKPEQLPSFLATLSQASIKKTTRCLIEWQLHTITRPNEAAGAKWEEIDLTNKLWTIPAERMKQRRAHSIPLTAQALALLEVMRPISGHREYIFPADRDPKKPTNSQTANAAIKRMGFKGALVAHGLRSIASTTLNEQGFDVDVIESALSHVDKDEVRRAYNRADYLERRFKLMEWWSNYIESAATGSVSLAGGVRGLRVVNE